MAVLFAMLSAVAFAASGLVVVSSKSAIHEGLAATVGVAGAVFALCSVACVIASTLHKAAKDAHADAIKLQGLAGRIGERLDTIEADVSLLRKVKESEYVRAKKAAHKATPQGGP